MLAHCLIKRLNHCCRFTKKDHQCLREPVDDTGKNVFKMGFCCSKMRTELQNKEP